MLQKKGRKEKKSGQLTSMCMSARRYQLLSVLCKSLYEKKFGIWAVAGYIFSS